MTPLASAILARLLERPGDELVLGDFARIARTLGVEPWGDFTVSLRPNAIVFAGVSTELADALAEVLELTRDEGSTVRARMMGEGEAILVYGFDAAPIPVAPIAKRAPRDPEKGYAAPRWIPVAIYCERPA